MATALTVTLTVASALALCFQVVDRNLLSMTYTPELEFLAHSKDYFELVAGNIDEYNCDE